MQSNIGWDEQTVIRKNNTGPRVARDKATVNAAMRSGDLSTEKKYAAGSNMAKNMTTDKNTARIDEVTEAGHVPTVNKGVSQAIKDGRAALGMTQKDLATKINEKVQVVTEYEAEKATPNQAVLAKMERALKVKLRGNNIGSPLEPRGGAKK